MSKPMIDPSRVEVVFMQSLCKEDEPPPDGHIMAEGIMCTVAFHPDRLESHREEVRQMLSCLPREFLVPQLGGEGGWSFLNACNDRDGNLWTGLHNRMEQLFQLGTALGMVKCPMPRNLWSFLPGGMPYYSVNPSTKEKRRIDPAGAGSRAGTDTAEAVRGRGGSAARERGRLMASDDMADKLAKAVVNALAEVPVWTCSTCGCSNWRERCQRCLAPKPKAKGRAD